MVDEPEGVRSLAVGLSGILVLCLLPSTATASAWTTSASTVDCRTSAQVTDVRVDGIACSVASQITIAVAWCDAGGCFYNTTGTASYSSSQAGFLDVENDIYDPSIGPMATCQQLQTSLSTNATCSGSAGTTFVAVSANACHTLYHQAIGFTRFAPHGDSPWLNYAAASRPLHFCRDAAGDPSIA